MSAEPKQHLVMDDFISLTYQEKLTPTLQRFGEHLLAGRIVGHRSPSGNVYVPGRGYDPLTLELTTDDDETQVADTGTLTAFTVITPIQYYGQQETQPFVMGSVVFDGASNAIAQQRIHVSHEEVRSGLRVRSIWKSAADRSLVGMSNRWWGGLECAIAGFEPTGEPDVSEEWVKEHMF